jgi:adenylate cyclase
MVPERKPVIAGLGAALAVLLALLLMPEDWRTGLRERGFDLLLTHAPAQQTTVPIPIVFVDIDSESLAAFGPWPWRREAVAALIERVTAAEPKVVAVDILFAGEDTRSPAALARRLATEADQPTLLDLAKTLPDGDIRLAEAIAGKPVVLGAVLADEGGEALPFAEWLARPSGGWRAGGAIGPPKTIAEKAAGIGIISLAGDADGVIRRVPLAGIAGSIVAPAVSSDVLRLLGGIPHNNEMLEFPAQPSITLNVARWKLVLLSQRAELRLLPLSGEQIFRRISARELLIGAADPNIFKTAIVVLGGSAPELGSLRHSLAGPLTPSAEIHARAIWQMLALRAPHAPSPRHPLQWLAIPLLVALAIAAPIMLSPFISAIAMSTAIVFLGGTALLMARGELLIDILPPVAAGLAAFAAASLAAFSANRRRHQRLSARFGQHLAPAVVARILAEPDAVKLGGERRVITALFSDIEGFSTMAGRAAPEDLIGVLDGYFEGVTAIITRHGGMVDKFVGDAVHAFFNMPLDLTDHAKAARAAAEDVIHWTELYRLEALPTRLGLGRTRIGIESGPAIVGDVGLATKLDYTAHGAVVNTAARLEALNKETGTSILIGPGAAAMIGPERLRALGERELRGIGTLNVFSV